MIKPWVLSISTAALTLCSSLSLSQDADIPRTANGRPDLQGVWTNKTLVR